MPRASGQWALKRGASFLPQTVTGG